MNGIRLTVYILTAFALCGSLLAGPLEPEAALQSFTLPDGLELEVVACEPMVVDPVAISFDHRGRMYVAEYRDYPHGPPQGKPPLSRIRLLEDTDGDGRMDRGHNFVERLSFAQGVLAFRKGVLVTAAPQILYFEDTDGDGQADKKEVLFEGFKPGNPQLRVAHPRRGIDNWIYLTNGLSGGTVYRAGQPERKINLGRRDFRFHPDTMEFAANSGIGQFGNTFDDWGNRFFCSNRNPTMYAPLPYRIWTRNPFALIAAAHEDVAPSGGDAKVYPLVDAKVTFHGHSGTHTAACGVTVYRGDALGPDYQGNIFVCEPTGSLVTQNLVESHGASFRVRRAREKVDFLASTDPWCRPVSLANGPDGNLYLVDMYREVIEHPQYMPDGLAKTLNLRGGDDRGRIYRIRRKQPDAGPADFTEPKSADDLLALLREKNGWRRDLGQRLIVETKKTDLADQLAACLKDTSLDPRTRAHAVWTLAGLGKLTPAHVRQSLADPSPRVRSQAVRVCGKLLGPDEALQKQLAAASDDADPRVRYEVLLALGDVEAESVLPQMLDIVLRDLNDPWVRKGLQTGVKTRSAEAFRQLVARKPFAETASPRKIELAADLTAITGARGNLDELKSLLSLIVAPGADAWWQTAALTGVAQGLGRHHGSLGRTSLAKLLAGPPEQLADLTPKVQTLFDSTAKIAADNERSTGDRVAAIGLLGYRGFDRVRDTLAGMLEGQQPLQVQLACIQALQTTGDDRAAEIIIAHWKSLSPRTKSDAIDMLLRRQGMTERLLNAMSEGDVGKSVLTLDQRQRLLRSRNKEIKSLASKLFGGEISANRKQVIADYRQALELPSDVARGEKAFKKLCMACHRIGKLGHVVGPDITDVRNKTKETLLYDILDPNRAVEPRWVNYTVITQDGKVLTGLLVNESDAAIVLRRAEGKEDVIPRGEIDEIAATGKSLMPEGVEKDFSPQDIADVLAFLKSQR